MILKSISKYKQIGWKKNKKYQIDSEEKKKGLANSGCDRSNMDWIITPIIEIYFEKLDSNFEEILNG